ncbi:MAG: winged helix-turn-helix domain-containing protein [Acidobacteriia bacterium]|nr:winged helix-turn-helix domain-containing protein [Terriglobia bacterium]
MESNFNFGNYRFETESGRLWSGAEELRLTPKASAVLKILVMRAGQPVTKEHLFASVWNGTAVSDDALTSCIQELRKALADDARQPRFIETRHRRGYRFVAPISEPPSAPVVDSVPPGRDLPAIAVLPFADMSPARDQDYLCEGLAEELINALTRIDGLRVASRTASFQFRSPGEDIQAVGRHLGVGTLLEGSVRKSDNRLRVTVQLIEVATGFHRWSQRFDRTLDDVLAIEDEIAEHVVTSVGRSVLRHHEKPSVVRPHTRAEAYEYYLRGRQHLHRMTKADLEKSGELFECAIKQDAAYGPAWGCLAAVHATLYEWFGSKEDDLSTAERASQKALELAPSLAEPHVARGLALSLSRRYEEAAQEFEQAIHLNPNFFEAYYYFARSCFAHGEIQRSAELFRKAAEARQEDFQSAMLQGQSLRMLGRIEEARAATREGIRRAERTLMLNPTDCRALSLGSGALFETGQEARALEWSQRSLDLYPDDMSTLINAACLHAKARQKEEALALLERVFARGWGKRDWIEQDADYDILRDDPRFQKLVAALK